MCCCQSIIHICARGDETLKNSGLDDGLLLEGQSFGS